jgi:hypothetical protein
VQSPNDFGRKGAKFGAMCPQIRYLGREAFDPGAESCVWCQSVCVTGRSCPQPLFSGRCGPLPILAVMITTT